jgi:site-specific DNA-methyltransferase (adenine-specific)
MSGEVWRSKGGEVELRLGRWQDVLADVASCDAVITDPPYGSRTHDGNADRLEEMGREPIGYQCWNDTHVAEFVDRWSGRCRAWVCGMTSDDLIPSWRKHYANRGRYDFAPVPVLAHRLRMAGDGPASSAVYLMPSRPRSREFSGWGSLPGWYEAGVERGASVIGAKPLALMSKIISDYSLPGDLIVDPCAGGATTLLSAAIEGRRSIGSEMDPVTYLKAVHRLEKGWTLKMRFDCPPEMKQPGLL